MENHRDYELSYRNIATTVHLRPLEESWRNALASLLLMPLAGTGQRERKLIDEVHMPCPDGEEVGSRKT